MDLPVQIPILRRSWYVAEIAEFQRTSDEEVIAQLYRECPFTVTLQQRDAWLAEFSMLRTALLDRTGKIYLEFTIPRMGHRVDAVLFIRGIVIAVEFKIGAKEYLAGDTDQACDYALDLKYFHEGSHHLSVVPMLVASRAAPGSIHVVPHRQIPGLFETIHASEASLSEAISLVLDRCPSHPMDAGIWEISRYCPTPTIVEAARALYAGHDVADLSRNDAGAINLSETSDQLTRIIEDTRAKGEKAICFVTGVPGAGKTLAGLNMATHYNDPESELHSVFLSGNAPLVEILREALARDAFLRSRTAGRRIKKGEAKARVKSFIQHVHHFRDECLRDWTRPPIDHVAIFDEAQRAWDLVKTASFMHRKKGVPDFNESEPEFLISSMNRRSDWAVIICLVGGGQEINTGEAGIGEWIESIRRSFAGWHLYISPALRDSEYGAGAVLDALKNRPKVHYIDSLHLAVSVRSFRAENVSTFVKLILDLETPRAKDVLSEFLDRYPVVLMRNLDRARQWLRDQARGSERYGIVVSSQAERLKPYAIDVRSPVNPVKWFLDGKDDVRSSYYLEDVATEFHVQGLELDWACICWDGDFRHTSNGWQHYSFRGTKWQRIHQPARRNYLKNAYRVLLTRARQGMVICVPEGSASDPTRKPEFYDSTFAYLQSVGIPVVT